MNRRTFTASLAISTAWAGLGRPSFAEPAAGTVPVPYTVDLTPPMDSEDKFVAWGVKVRGEDPTYLKERFERFRHVVGNRDATDERDKRAFLMTPRESFVLKQNLDRAYDHAFLDIGFGVTISGPHIVARMTQVIDVKPGDKVLEIGTGSGYQSAYLSYLTDKVWTIEIIKPLSERTTSIRQALIDKGYSEYKAIQAKNADGYYGWEEAGPFDKIIVTCGIDHVPPPLLQQLKVGRRHGDPGRAARRAARPEDRQEQQDKDGQITVARSDIYNGKIVPFVPFTKLADDGKIEGTHNK